MDNSIEKESQSPFDSETEEEKIALSKDELDNILSEAEIVQEASPEEKSASENKETATSTEAESEALLAESEEEFDISGEIDQLSPEDLEDIEIAEGEVDNYSQELENNLGGEIELPEMTDEKLTEEISDEELEKELEEFDTSSMQLEANIDEEMDLDTYLDTVKSDSDLNPIEKKEEAQEEEEQEEEILEPPVLGETEDIEIDVEDAFKEAGIEEPHVTEEQENLEEELETQPQEAQASEVLHEEALEAGEIQLPEESQEEVEEEAINEEPAVSQETESLEGEIELTEEEEKILNEDLDITAEETPLEEKEEVVSLSGEEFNQIVQEETVEESPEGETTSVDKTLYNDITVILKYMDALLGDLPDDKIEEFARSKYFKLYKEVFSKLGIS